MKIGAGSVEELDDGRIDVPQGVRCRSPDPDLGSRGVDSPAGPPQAVPSNDPVPGDEPRVPLPERDDLASTTSRVTMSAAGDRDQPRAVERGTPFWMAIRTSPVSWISRRSRWS